MKKPRVWSSLVAQDSTEDHVAGGLELSLPTLLRLTRWTHSQPHTEPGSSTVYSEALERNLESRLAPMSPSGLWGRRWGSLCSDSLVGIK